MSVCAADPPPKNCAARVLFEHKSNLSAGPRYHKIRTGRERLHAERIIDPQGASGLVPPPFDLLTENAAQLLEAALRRLHAALVMRYFLACHSLVRILAPRGIFAR
jgi:hypothetical protein